MYPTVNFVSYNGMLIFKKNIHNIPGYCVRILSAEIRRKIQKKMLSKPGFLGQIWLTSLLAIYFLFHTRSSQDRGVSKEGLKLTLEDLPSYKSLFWGIQHLFVEKGFILLDLPWVQKSRFKHLLIHKRIIPCSSGIYCRDARFLNSHKLITMIHHINSWRLKTIWSSIDSEKVLTKFKCHL